MGVSLGQQTQSAINCEGPGGQSEGAGGQDTRGKEGWGGRRWKKDSCVDGASWGTSPQRGQALPVMDDSGGKVSPLQTAVPMVSPTHGQTLKAKAG